MCAATSWPSTPRLDEGGDGAALVGLGTPLHDGSLHGGVGQLVDTVIERVAAPTDRGVGRQPVPGDGALLRERPERPPKVLMLDGLAATA